MKKTLSLAAVLIMVFLSAASCGRKAPPRLPAYERPPEPVSLEAVHRESSVILDWDYPIGKLRFVREFQVLRSGGPLGTTEETHFVDTNVKPGLKYEYTVLAVSTSGIISEGSAQVRVKITEVPAAPESLEAEVEDRGVRLIWSASGEGRLFNVYRSYEDPLELVRPLNGEPLSGTVFIDNPLMERPVYYTVRAIVGGVERHEGPGSEVVMLGPEVFVPSAPTGLKAVAAGERILIAWKENPEIWVRAYRIYRSVDGGDYVSIGESRTPSFIDGEPPPGRLSYMLKAMGPAVEGPFSEPFAPK